MANKLRQLGDLPGQGTALAAPEDNEAESLKEKQANVDAVAAPYASAPAVAPVAYPPIDPNAQYGNRPGEQRIDVSNMITPLGSARAQGGPVEPAKPYVVGEQGPEVIVPKEKGTVIPSAHYVQGESPKRPVPQELGSAMYNPAQDEANSAVVQQQTQQALQNQLLNSPMAMPMRAEGGDIEADQPTLVGEEGPEVVAPEGGAPDTASGTPSAKPFGGVEPESKPTDPLKLAADQHANQAKDVAQQRATIHEDKKAAASKGDLVGLGMAKIHENELNKSEAERSVLQEATAIPKPLVEGSLAGAQKFAAGLPGTATAEERKAAVGVAPTGSYSPTSEPPSAEGLPTSARTNLGMTEPAPNAGGLPTSSNTNPGLGSAMVAKPTPETEHADLEHKREALKQTIAGPDTEAAGVATRQLAELNKQNPWGTAGNHPGALGKIAHGFAKAGNIAGDIAIPGVMTNIPGSERNLDKQVGEGMAEEAQGATINKEDAQAKAAAAKTTNAQKYDIKEVVDNRPGSPTQGKTVWAGVNPTDPTDVKYSPGEVAPKGKTGAEAIANPTQVGEYTAQVPALTPYLNPEERRAYEFPTGYTPTLAEIATNKKDAVAANAAALSGNREERAQVTADAAAKKLSMEERIIESTAKSISSMDVHDLSPIKSLASLRGDQRLQVYERAKELNPNFNTAEVDRKSKMLDQFTNGKEGQNLQSFGTFFEHAANLSEAINDLRNTGFKDFNHPWNWFRDHTGDPRIANFLAASEPVKKEFESFLLNNRALYESDRKEMNDVLGSNMAPDALQTVIGTMGHTAQARYNEMDHRFKNTMKVGIEEGIGPMAPEAITAANKIGVKIGKQGGEEKSATNAPAKGATQSHKGANYVFDGTQWKKQ